MIKVPFKTHGVYARKLDPYTEMENYSSTKLDRIWKVATNQTEGYHYQLLWIYKPRDKDRSESDSEYFVGMCIMAGELLKLVDMHKTRSPERDYKTLTYTDNGIKFRNDRIECSGYFIDEIENIHFDNLFLDIYNYQRNQTFNRIYRFVPFSSY